MFAWICEYEKAAEFSFGPARHPLVWQRAPAAWGGPVDDGVPVHVRTPQVASAAAEEHRRPAGREEFFTVEFVAGALHSSTVVRLKRSTSSRCASPRFVGVELLD